jgi:hypothetical protein
MTRKTTLIAIFTAVGLGLVSVASAHANTNSLSGSTIGPLGHQFDDSYNWRGYQGHVYVVPHHAYRHMHTRRYQSNESPD